MSIDLDLCKAQIAKVIQSGGFLGSLLSTLAGPLMKVAIPLAKHILAPLGIAAPSAIDARIQKKMDGFGTTTLIISNKEMNDMMKIVQALEDSNILLKGVTKTIKNEIKVQKVGFLSMLLGTLGATLLGNLLAGKGIVRASSGRRSLTSSTSYGNKKKKRNCKGWLWKRMGFLMSPHPLTNFEIQKYYQYEPRFNGVILRDNLQKKIKDKAYVINFDEYPDVGTH